MIKNTTIKFYTREDVKELMGISKKTVDELFASRDFPAFTRGKTYLVEEEALKEYFKKRRD